MKAVLVYPSIVDVSRRFQINTLAKLPAQMPLGILYLAAVLEQKDHQVKVYDNELDETPNSKLSQEILEYDPDVVGLSTTFKNIGNGREIARQIKAKNKKIKIIFGGPQASCLAQEVIKHSFIDIVAVGEAEEILAEILDKNFSELEKIPGLIFKDSSGKLTFTGIRTPVKDLDSLPFPARHLIDVHEYKRKWPRATNFTVFTSRGCPYRCTFCSLPDYYKKYRTRSPMKVVDEIEHLIKTFEIREFDFSEDNFAINPHRVRQICDEIIRRKIKVRWACCTRVDNVTPELLAKMKEAGLWLVFFGVESGSQRILDFLKKDITLDQVRNAFGWCRELGIDTLASFMLGIPGETKKDIFASFNLLRELDPPQFSFQTYVGIPGSELYDYVKKNELYSNVWESALIVSTGGLSRKEIIKMEKEIHFRSVLFKWLRMFKIPFPSASEKYYHNRKHLKNIITKITDALNLVQTNSEKAKALFQRINMHLKKARNPDAFTKKFAAIIGLLLEMFSKREKLI